MAFAIVHPELLAQEEAALLRSSVTVAEHNLARLRRLLLEVASLGICTDEDRVGPPRPGHQWVEMPVALWDRLEAEVR